MQSTFNDGELATIRRAYARQVLSLAGAADAHGLEKAFATVRRERFLGPAPWQVVRPFGHLLALSSDEPVLAYQDVPFALMPERGVNNGQPSLHAHWLHQAGLLDGDRVAHIGAGTGYYSALIAHLVGDEGRVLAIEVDPTLAERAVGNLAHLPNVTVVQGDGATFPQEEVDCVYVNFSVARPAELWLEALAPRGRLLFPLGVPRPSRSPGGGIHALNGAGLRIERGSLGFLARWIGPAFFVCAEGPLFGTSEEHMALKTAFDRGGIANVRSLLWRQPIPAERCWFAGREWALSYDDAS